MPGLLRQVQVELYRQGFGYRQGLLTERRQGPRGTAELQGEQAWLEFLQALTVAGHRPQPAGDLHAQSDRRCMLQPGTPGQRRIGMRLGLTRQ
ncbi:hypothetical protein D3C84_1095700 [compost metagenome]